MEQFILESVKKRKALFKKRAKAKSNQTFEEEICFFLKKSVNQSTLMASKLDNANYENRGNYCLFFAKRLISGNSP
ncbi:MULTISPECIES: hypothetical protein [Neobacillus]|uniref:Uncharacterized protein n=1 Tax=Neobacillus rhizophilus TaxID=2833579 RepID=A0A942U1Y2_9BACI|nr:MULTISPECIES: hypothetical protein [Neobacillus]MBS4213070.1 hypothetical protein [Neobacillus rhizophilus]MBU8914807.1 hypothetical protein [Bacillus sp. FJAT-29953]